MSEKLAESIIPAAMALENPSHTSDTCPRRRPRATLSGRATAETVIERQLRPQRYRSLSPRMIRILQGCLELIVSEPG